MSTTPASGERVAEPHAGGPLRIDVFSIFPQMLEQFWTWSVVGRGREAGLVDLRAHDLRAGATDRHRTVDDAPFGGGAGMVLRPEPVFAAVEAVEPIRPLYLLGPSGRPFDQTLARQLADGDGFSLLCGRYEGVDERIRVHLCDEELSVGDVVLAGGEVAAMLVVEAVARLVPGVLGNSSSSEDESFAAGLLEYPQWTRPATFRGWEVPEALLSGDHGRIASWRRAMALARTARLRPDLLAARGGLTAEEEELLAHWSGPEGEDPRHP